MVITPEEILEKAKKMIGQETEAAPGRYPVEYEPIRRYCHMVEDDNPIFLDPEYAKKTMHGEVVCPPFQIYNFGSPGPWPPGEAMDPFMHQLPTTPGSSFMVMGNDWEFFRTVRVGDRIWMKNRFVDIYIKAIRRDPKARWIVTERMYTNQDGDKVASWRMTVVAVRSPEEVKASGDAPEGQR